MIYTIISERDIFLFVVMLVLLVYVPFEVVSSLHCKTLYTARIRNNFKKENNLTKKTKTGFKLYNKNVFLTYNKKQDEITCYNLKETEQKFILKDVKSVKIEFSRICSYAIVMNIDLDTKFLNSVTSLPDYNMEFVDLILSLFNLNTKYSDIISLMK